MAAAILSSITTAKSIVPSRASSLLMSSEFKFVPSFDLLCHKFTLLSPATDAKCKAAAQTQLLAEITKNNMAAYCAVLRECKINLPIDDAQIAKMNEENAQKIAELDAKIADSEKNLGEVDTLGFFIEKANFLCATSEKDEAVAVLRAIVARTAAVGTKIDAFFALVRLGFIFEDVPLLNEALESAASLMEKGGDWDRRNRFKVYEGLSLLQKREFARAATLLSASLATFTSVGLVSFLQIAKYAIVSGIFSFSRAQLKAKIVNNPEIAEVLNELPLHRDLLQSFYAGKYAEFFAALALVEADAERDYFLHENTGFVVKELRIAAYNQLLRSYKTISLFSVAQAFGVTSAFIDEELSRWVIAERICCTIDKVSNVITTTRRDTTNAKYQSVVKRGDALLNHTQRLSRLVNV